MPILRVDQPRCRPFGYFLSSGLPGGPGQVLPAGIREQGHPGTAVLLKLEASRVDDRPGRGSGEIAFLVHDVADGGLGHGSGYLITIIHQRQVGDRWLNGSSWLRIPPMGSSTKGSIECTLIAGYAFFRPWLLPVKVPPVP